MPATSPPRKPPPPPTCLSLIDPEHDDLIPARTLAKKRLGRDVSPACLWRWIRKGARGTKLECVQIMGVWCTTEAAWGAFVTGQTRAALGASRVAPGPRTAEKAARLRAAGLLK
jgi:hypothetical protein